MSVMLTSCHCGGSLSDITGDYPTNITHAAMCNRCRLIFIEPLQPIKHIRIIVDSRPIREALARLCDELIMLKERQCNEAG